MELGDLEFKAEDFKELETYRGNARPTIETAGAVLANFCNALLRDRLARAPQLTGFVGDDGEPVHEWEPENEDSEDDSHSGRLVCIQPRRQ
jgi:hypothetical protein